MLTNNSGVTLLYVIELKWGTEVVMMTMTIELI